MSIALIGATGRAGSRILAELVQRGQTVTAIVRHPEKVAPSANVTAVSGDVKNGEALAELLKGHDAVISAVHFNDTDLPVLISAVKTSGVPRWLVVGGAGSLFVAPGKQLVDQPDFPEAYRTEAGKGRDFLNLLKAEEDVDWTFISPSALIFEGERTGTYRLGGDDLLIGADGKSQISFEDFAVALVDELENAAHPRQRITAGY